MRFLLDTNVLSEFRRPRPDMQVMAWLEAANEDSLFVSVVSLGELREGVARLPSGRRKIDLDHWLREELPRRFEGRVLDITPTIADEWGEVSAEAKRRGVGLYAIDAFLLATTRRHSLILVTRNVKDFAAFDITIVDPWLT